MRSYLVCKQPFSKGGKLFSLSGLIGFSGYFSRAANGQGLSSLSLAGDPKQEDQFLYSLQKSDVALTVCTFAAAVVHGLIVMKNCGDRAKTLLTEGASKKIIRNWKNRQIVTSILWTVLAPLLVHAFCSGLMKGLMMLPGCGAL